MSKSFTVTITLPISTIMVPVGRDSDVWNVVDMSKIPLPVIEAALKAGFYKALTDVSDKDADAASLKALRDKRIATWEGGDWAAKGGGAADPVTAQMREELIAERMAAGEGRKVAEKAIKGTAAQYIASIVDAYAEANPDADKAALTAKLDGKYRALAEATIMARTKAKQAAKGFDTNAMLAGMI